MKRRLIAAVAALALCAASAAPAFADAGAPGSTFPEQPATPTAACTSVVGHPNMAAESPTAAAIQMGLYMDACLGS